MIHRLPTWVWVGGFALAGVAGCINTVGLLGVHHQGLTHMTGLASALGIAASNANGQVLVNASSLIGAFVLGAACCGVLIKDTALLPGRRYGIALMGEAALIASATLLLAKGHAWADLLLAMAAGLQNAMATTYSQTIVRTTHLTGVFTDLGLALGHALRGQPWETRKTSLHLAIVGGFATGCVSGAWGFKHLGVLTLWVPAALVGTSGLVHFVRRHRRQRGGPKAQTSNN